MGTTLSEVYDFFMMTVTDYRLIDLFNTSVPDFENYLQAWLEYSIVDFSVCDQDLDFDDTTKEFPVVLTRDNKVVLATLMMKYWLQKAVNDVTQFNLHITDRDFKVASEAQNLREKSNHLNMIKEQCSQLLQDYAYNRNSWVDWYAQDFGG
jgi:hypothetical protein